MSATLAEALARFGPGSRAAHGLSRAQAKAWRAIAACRTPALGGQQFACDACGSTQWRWHSCRSRHCPRCQKQAADAWRRARLAELLAVPYAHLVFTLPHELNALARRHPRWVYETLLACTAATLTEFAANPRWLGGRPSFTLVLHTWTQDLRLHIHAHALMACGALDAEGGWIAPRRTERFLFPVHALSRVFAGKFRAALRAAERDGTLRDDPLPAAGQRQRRLQRLTEKNWVVYAKTPLAGPAAVLDYLARYTHRTAIGHERILAVRDDGVRLRVRADGNGGKNAGKNAGKKIVRIDGAEFVGRFLQHVLPAGFKRIRHYGLLAPAHKTRCLSQARAALAMPVPNPIAQETVAAFMRRLARIETERCPRCHGCWRPIAHAAPLRTSLWPRAGSTTPQVAAPQTAAQPQAP
ncbi:MAG: IS91 family transposase [Betaproteobacteria bacterium]